MATSKGVVIRLLVAGSSGRAPLGLRTELKLPPGDEGHLVPLTVEALTVPFRSWPGLGLVGLLLPEVDAGLADGDPGRGTPGSEARSFGFSSLSSKPSSSPPSESRLSSKGDIVGRRKEEGGGKTRSLDRLTACFSELELEWVKTVQFCLELSLFCMRYPQEMRRIGRP